MTTANPPRLAEIHRSHPDFDDFVNQGSGSSCPKYVFFTTGLLHVFAAMARRLPPACDLRVVTAGLAEEELDWLRSTVRWPVLNLVSRTDDRFVWEELARCSTTDFLWLDVDLLVHDTTILDELAGTLAAGDVAVAGCLSHRPLRLISTPIAAISRRALDAVTEKCGPIHLGAYGWSFDSREPLTGPEMTRAQWAAVSSLLILDDHGRPTGSQSGIYEVHNGTFHVAPGTAPDRLGAGARRSHLFLDTLIGYQLLAFTAGYAPAPIRDYANTHRLGKDISHIGGASYLRRELGLPSYPVATTEPDALPADAQPLLPRLSTLAIELVVLHDFGERFDVPGYRRLHDATCEALRRRGVLPTDLIARGQQLLGLLGA